jgi:hypothetical protein
MTSEIHLDRLRYVAGHYRELQGLSLVPFGLIFLAPGFIPGGWGQQGETWRWLAIIGAVWLSWLASMYYQRVVGRAWPALRTGGSYRWLAIMIGGALLLGYFAAPWYDGLVNPPISVTAFVMAGLLLIPFVAARGRYRHHYLYLALLYVAVALLPLTGLVTSAQLVEDPWLFSVFYGLPWIIGGLGDHIFLMRSLKPLPQEAVDGGI